MLDRTRAAVARQTKAMGCAAYDIGIRAEKGLLTRTWPAPELVNALDWLRRQNAQGADIYIRPAQAEAHGLVLVDDLKLGALEQMKADGLVPALIVETSPQNHQAWIKLPEPAAPAVRGAVARVLARTYGGDPASADAVHFGRLAGFTNRKPKHADGTGRAPFVLLHSYAGRAVEAAAALIEKARAAMVATRAPELREFMSQQQEVLPEALPIASDAERFHPARDWYQALWSSLKKRFGDEFDASRADWMAALVAFRRRYRHDEVAMIVRTYSPGLDQRKTDADDYVLRTVGKAEIWHELEAQGAEYGQVRDQLLPLAQARAAERERGQGTAGKKRRLDTP